MTNDTYNDQTVRLDPLYSEANLHIQTGEWDEAIRVLEELQVKYPESSLVENALQDTMFKGDREDKGTRISGKRTTLRLGPILFRAVVIAVLVSLIYFGSKALIEGVQPLIQQARETRKNEELLVEASAYLESGDLEQAETRFTTVLQTDPVNLIATEGLAAIQHKRDIEALYQEAVALEDAGNIEDALEAYYELNELSPRYQDSTGRIEAIEQKLTVESLFLAAESDYKQGRFDEAMDKFVRVRAMNVTYEQEVVTARLFELYMSAGNDIINQDPPVFEQLPTALDYFTKALALKPRSQQAGIEQQLVKYFIEGQRYYYEEDWDNAISYLRIVYDTRSDYLGETILRMLYESYVRSGDYHNNNGDTAFAYERYRLASELPVEDKIWAEGRLFYIKPYLTPTATPTPTSTPRPVIAGGGSGYPAATPRPLSTYYNRIVFMSDEVARGELWVMNADGTNRQRLGTEWELREQFEELRDEERYSPDHSRFAFVQNRSENDATPQVFLSIPVNSRVTGQPWYERITDHNSMCYEPVWSPDGETIAFVSEVLGSDDIWLVNIDSTHPRPLTPNEWEWDRHPSYSPDGEYIVFFSNRTGIMQLYTMKSDGSEVTNISNTNWDEFDPIWIK